MEKTIYEGKTLYFGFNDKIKDALGSTWLLDTSDDSRTEYECLIKTQSPEYIMDFCPLSMKRKIKADPERAWAEWKQCANAARHAAAKRMYEVWQITTNIPTTLLEKVTDEDIRRFNELLGKLGCEIAAGPNEKSPDFFLRSDCKEIGHGVRGTLEEAKAEADDFFFSGKDGMIYTYDGEPVAIKRWLGRERRFADWADVSPEDHVPHFGPITNASYGIGIPQIFMRPALKGNEPELANLQEVYVAACDYGDFKMGFYADADEAAEAAEDAWSSLALDEKRRQHIFSGVIRREDLNFDHMDDDILAEGRVDWWCYAKKIGTYPGAFDSAHLFSEEQVKDVLEDGWEDGCYEFENNQHIYSIALSSDGNYITDFATDDRGKSFSVSYPDGEYSDNGFEAACKELAEKVNAYLCPYVR